MKQCTISRYHNRHKRGQMHDKINRYRNLVSFYRNKKNNNLSSSLCSLRVPHDFEQRSGNTAHFSRESSLSENSWSRDDSRTQSSSMSDHEKTLPNTANFTFWEERGAAFGNVIIQFGINSKTIKLVRRSGDELGKGEKIMVGSGGDGYDEMV